MSHSVNGFDVKFTGRRSWKAERRFKNRTLDIIPVTWTKGKRHDGQDEFLEVWYRSAEELQDRMVDPNPFVVALAVAKDYLEVPHAFDRFEGIFRVVTTGNVLSENSIETRIIEPVTADELAEA